MLKPFELQRVVEVPADPQTVFQAVTTGTGGWMFPSEVEPGVGGSGAQDPKVTAWEPGAHFAVQVGDERGFYNKLDYAIETADGGSVLRYQHRSVIEESEWDTQFAACDNHTDFYLHTLGEYVAHFAGRPVTYIDLQGPASSTAPDAFETLRAALGIEAVGQQVDVDVPGLGTLSATVDYLSPNFIGLRTEDALYRFFGRNAWGGPVGLAAHIFTDTDPSATEQALQNWLNTVFG